MRFILIFPIVLLMMACSRADKSEVKSLNNKIIIKKFESTVWWITLKSSIG
jgi:hypothetical protein